MRPHDIDIRRESSSESAFSAVVSHVHAIGPVVRLELRRSDDSELIEAELTRERYDELLLKSGEQVFIKPRNLRLFLQ